MAGAGEIKDQLNWQNLGISFQNDYSGPLALDSEKFGRYILSLLQSIHEQDWDDLLVDGQVFSEHKVVLSLCLVDSEQMKSINHQYRNIEKDTDVLSFPVWEDFKSENIIGPVINLGDLVVSVERASEQADQFQLSLEEEMLHLVVHGFLHLIGLDHELGAKEQEMMEQWEKKLILAVKAKLSS